MNDVVKECRICFDDEKNDEFIAPCLCSGTSKYVHISCLEKWRELNKYRPAYDKCMECHFEYKLKKEHQEETLYFNSSYYKLNTFIYVFTIPIAAISNVYHNKDIFILTILDFGNTDKTSKYCMQSPYRNETYCEPGSLYGILNSGDWFTLFFFYLNFYISLQLIIINFYYIYITNKHIIRIKEFRKKNKKKYFYWLLNVFKFYFMYYICIYLFESPSILIGYIYVANLLEGNLLNGFSYFHNRTITKLNYDNSETILPYESSDDEDIFPFDIIEQEESPINY